MARAQGRCGQWRKRSCRPHQARTGIPSLRRSFRNQRGRPRKELPRLLCRGPAETRAEPHLDETTEEHGVECAYGQRHKQAEAPSQLVPAGAPLWTASCRSSTERIRRAPDGPMPAVGLGAARQRGPAPGARALLVPRLSGPFQRRPLALVHRPFVRYSA